MKTLTQPKPFTDLPKGKGKGHTPSPPRPQANQDLPGRKGAALGVLPPDPPQISAANPADTAEPAELGLVHGQALASKKL